MALVSFNDTISDKWTTTSQKKYHCVGYVSQFLVDYMYKNYAVILVAYAYVHPSQ